MERFVRYVLGALACVLTSLPLAAQRERVAGDSVEVALLTCSPGQEIYEYYGHTALLVRDLTLGNAYVFNYGVFNYSEPNFVWRFVRGKTDYMVACAPLQLFLREYEDRGSSVRADFLNLSQAEARELFYALVENCRPENRTYRYNIFHDNCATRVRDMIARAAGGQLTYHNEVKRQSLRNIVNRCSAPYRWSVFGQNLLLGAEADRAAPREVQQFAPEILQEDLLQATVADSSGGSRPLVTRSEMLVPLREVPLKEGFPLSPLACALILLAVTLCVNEWDRCRRRLAWGYDCLLLAAQGLAGCIVTLLFFGSEHPTLDSNWLVLLLNPLPLVFLWPTLRTERRRRTAWYHRVAAVWLLLFLVSVAWLPQEISVTAVVLALCLLLRSLANVRLTRTWHPTEKTSIGK